MVGGMPFTRGDRGHQMRPPPTSKIAEQLFWPLAQTISSTYASPIPNPERAHGWGKRLGSPQSIHMKVCQDTRLANDNYDEGHATVATVTAAG